MSSPFSFAQAGKNLKKPNQKLAGRGLSAGRQGFSPDDTLLQVVDRLGGQLVGAGPAVARPGDAQGVRVALDADLGIAVRAAGVVELVGVDPPEQAERHQSHRDTGDFQKEVVEQALLGVDALKLSPTGAGEDLVMAGVANYRRGLHVGQCSFIGVYSAVSGDLSICRGTRTEWTSSLSLVVSSYLSL